jgi:hypothetical protein
MLEVTPHNKPIKPTHISLRFIREDDLRRSTEVQRNIVLKKRAFIIYVCAYCRAGAPWLLRG